MEMHSPERSNSLEQPLHMQELDIRAIKLDDSIRVRSLMTKFVIPLSDTLASTGEPLVYPDGEHAGQPIVDWQNKPVGERGIVFRNHVDNCWQAATGGVIIINEVSTRTADKIYEAIALVKAQGGYTHSDGPDRFSLEDTKLLLELISEAARDCYSSTREYTDANFRPLHGEPWGFMQAVGKPAQVGYFSEPCTVSGLTATPQVFPNGAVFLRDNKGSRALQPDVFLRTYERLDGAPLTLDELPKINPETSTVPPLSGESMPAIARPTAPTEA